MKSSAGFPFHRVAIALLLSLLGHTLLLWQWPEFKLTNYFQRQPLEAQLAPLPKVKKKVILPKPEKKQLRQAPTAAEPAAPALETGNIVASAISPALAIAEAVTPPADDATYSPPLLPRHAQLTFAVQYGSGGFKVGEIKHILENRNGRYTLHADTQTTGLVNLFRRYQLAQTSTGSVSKLGLRPEIYTETKTDSSGKHTSSARFDWLNNKIHFANGSSKALLDQAQDILSLSYQLSQMPLNFETFPIALSNGRSFNPYFIAVGEETTISTAMGELKVIPLRKVQSTNEDGLIIWLALEYRLLPVKILYLDKSGEVTANMLITDIRVSDE